MGKYMGIDMGTSSVKVLLMAEDRSIIKECSKSYKFTTLANGATEINPEIWFQSLDIVMREVITNRTVINGIGITGQMHTTVFLDKNGNSIRPAILWNDTRTLSLLDKKLEQIKSDTRFDCFRNIVSTGSPAINLYWLKHEEPASFAKLKTFLIGPDYLVYKLTGVLGTDFCEASTSAMYDFAKNTWAKEVQDFLGLPQDIYPAIRGSSVCVGLLSKQLSERWQIDCATKVYVGTGDNAASAFAAGVVSKSNTVLSLGTSGVLISSRGRDELQNKGKNIAFSLNGEKITFLVQGVIQSAGYTWQWWTGKILQEIDFKDCLSAVDLNELGTNELLFYPHIRGDKTLYKDAKLRGAFFGLSDNSTRTDMNLAVLEGIALGVRQLAEVMHLSRERMEPLLVTGGGAKNNIWMQILADVLNVKVLQVAQKASAVYGIALLAKAANGKIINESYSLKGKYFYPRVKNVVLYGEKYKVYKKIYSAVQSIFHV